MTTLGNELATTRLDSFEELIEAAGEALETAGDRKRCRSLARRWRERTFHLAVLGQFKRGKSTLINALLGRNLLPSSALPVTAIPTFIRAGSPERLLVHRLDGTTQVFPLDQLDGFVTERGNPENRLRVERVEVYLSSPFLFPGLCLIDTPGIGSAFRHNTAVTMGMLAHCDAALFVFSPDPPLGEIELSFLENVAKVVPRIIPVLAKAEMVSPSELAELREYNRRLLEQVLGKSDVEVYAVSARRILEPAVALRNEVYEFWKLRDVLHHLLQSEGETLLRRAIAIRVLAWLEQAHNVLVLQHRALQLDEETCRQRLDQFNAEVDRLAREQETARDILEADIRRLLHFIDSEASDIAQRAGAEMRRQFEQLLANSATDPQQVRRGLPSVRQAVSEALEWVFTRERIELERAVRQRLSSIALDHQRRMAKIADELMAVAGALFNATLTSAVAPEDLEFRVEDYWPVVPPPVVLGAISLGALAPLLPLRWLRHYHARRLAQSLDESVRANTERLRWAMRNAVEHTMRALAEHFVEQYHELAEQLRRAFDSASRAATEAADRRQLEGETITTRLRRLEELIGKFRKEMAPGETRG